MSFISEEEFERLARNALIAFDLEYFRFQELMSLIIKMKRLDWVKNYERVPNSKMPLDEAEFNPHTRILRIREDIFCAANSGDPHALMTIAHEIGHIYLGHTRTRHRSVAGVEGREIEKIAPTIKRDEFQASRFAAAFRAPYHLANYQPGMTAHDLAQKFNLTVRAADIRLEQIEKMYRRENKISRPLPPMPAAKQQYERIACSNCKNFTMLRSGPIIKCDTCGHIGVARST